MFGGLRNEEDSKLRFWYEVFISFILSSTYAESLLSRLHTFFPHNAKLLCAICDLLSFVFSSDIKLLQIK